MAIINIDGRNKLIYEIAELPNTIQHSSKQKTPGEINFMALKYARMAEGPALDSHESRFLHEQAQKAVLKIPCRKVDILRGGISGKGLTEQLLDEFYSGHRLL